MSGVSFKEEPGRKKLVGRDFLWILIDIYGTDLIDELGGDEMEDDDNINKNSSGLRLYMSGSSGTSGAETQAHTCNGSEALSGCFLTVYNEGTATIENAASHCRSCTEVATLTGRN